MRVRTPNRELVLVSN